MSKPLTIEELKALPVNDWVWVVHPITSNGTYGKITGYDGYKYVETEDNRISLGDIHYGNTWLAYKNKEQAEDKDEIRKQTAKEILQEIFSNETCGDLGEFCDIGWVITQSEAQEYFKKYGVEVEE